LYLIPTCCTIPILVYRDIIHYSRCDPITLIFAKGMEAYMKAVKELCEKTGGLVSGRIK